MKLMKIQLFICFLVIFSATSSYALMSSEVKKAKEFMSVGMKPQAITILEKRIFDKPTDAQAHFFLATIYVSEGDLGNAKQRFKSAVMIDSDYGYQIGEVYKKEGLLAFDQGQYGQADRLLNTAFEYQPNLGKEIGQGYFKVGKKQLNNGNRNSADNFFSKAVRFDGTLKSPVLELNREYARNLLRAAKNKPANQRNRYVQEASKYLTTSEINSIYPSPEIRISKSGTYNIPVKVGSTSKWIIVDIGKNTSYKFRSSDWQFIVTYDDGQKVQAWSAKEWPAKKIVKCKITPLTNEPIKLIVY